jgi:hypothetical protein
MIADLERLFAFTMVNRANGAKGAEAPQHGPDNRQGNET